MFHLATFVDLPRTRPGMVLPALLLLGGALAGARNDTYVVRHSSFFLSQVWVHAGRSMTNTTVDTVDACAEICSGTKGCTVWSYACSTGRHDAVPPRTCFFSVDPAVQPVEYRAMLYFTSGCRAGSSEKCTAALPEPNATDRCSATPPTPRPGPSPTPPGPPKPPTPPGPPKPRTNVNNGYNCLNQNFAYEFGKTLVPRRGEFQDLFLALGMNQNNSARRCPKGLPEAVPSPPSDRALRGEHTFTGNRPVGVRVGAGAVFVDPTQGRDGAAGSIDAPLRSIQAALDLAASRASLADKVVVLRHGTHYIGSESLLVTAAHSGVTMTSHIGERATVSGGVKLDAAWAKAPGYGADQNVWVADLSHQDTVTRIPGLQIGGVRLTRARYPNLPGGVEASCGYGCVAGDGNRGSFRLQKGAPASWLPLVYYNDSAPEHLRTDTMAKIGDPDRRWFENYKVGIGGPCSVFDPPVSFWCSYQPDGGGAGDYTPLEGYQASPGVLPHSPYKTAEGMIFNIWHPKRWQNSMYEVSHYDPGLRNFTFGLGGQQGARTGAGQFYVENLIEELDYPSEWYFDERARKLYVYHNGTGAPPADAPVVAAQSMVIVNVSGTQWAPVTGFRAVGITYTASAYTYMAPHGSPSGGGTIAARYGAVFLQGTENAIIDSCNFTRLDGSGVCISGYNRNATVQNSDFEYMGENAILSWGYTNETRFDPGRPGVENLNWPQAGVDGTDGEHPRYNQIVGNTAREVGLYEKQSSFYFQAKTAQTTLTGNVFFNAPRAGIDFNDGFGGGDEVAWNLVFGTCRESADHGPFNSWDRQPFLTTVRTGQPSMIMEWRDLHHNFMIADYSSQEAIDNDDGSAYYHTHHNHFTSGSAMKSDFGGHSNHHHDNVYSWISGIQSLFFVASGAYDDLSANNTIAFGNHARGAWLMPHYDCWNYDAKANYTASKWGTTFRNNTYWTQDGAVHTCCMHENEPCHDGDGLPWDAWRRGGVIPGSTGFDRPPQDAHSKALLWLQGEQEMNYHLLNTARGMLDMPLEQWWEGKHGGIEGDDIVMPMH